MLSNPCPAGYYTAAGASSRQEAPVQYAYLCKAARFCASGTSASKVNQAECLPGYFCPRGTAASLTLEGTFGDGIHMKDPKDLIGQITKLIKKNREWLASERIDLQR